MLRRASLAAVLMLLSACTATIPDARFVCTTNAECPPDFTCVERLCRSMPGLDAGRQPDLGRDDLGRDDLGVRDDLGREDLGPIDLGPTDRMDLGSPDACDPRMEMCNGIDDNCNGVIDDGIDRETDVNNCGSCGNACMGTMPGCCGGVCTDLATDYDHCGSCGTVITGGGYLCCNGMAFPQTNCNAACASLPAACLDDCRIRGYCMP
jgi:hypothetical protein